MFDVVVYLSSLPKISDRNRKVEVLKAFAAGAQQAGASVFVQTKNQIVDCRLAVILGWVGSTIRGPHIQLRRNVIDHQLANGRHVMPIDANCFKFADPDSQFLRYSLDGVFYNTNFYSNKNSSPQKWNQIRQQLNIELKPWRINGNHILVCLQRDGGWSMKGTNMDMWTDQTVRKIRQLTDRPIVLRPHPKHHMNLNNLIRLPNVTQSSPGRTLQQDLTNAWASVFYNSSSSVASVLAGVPVFAGDDDCAAWGVANHDILQIETPATPEREQWLYDLCAAHWTDQESVNGEIYQKFLPNI